MYADEARIRQVLVNLIANALEAVDGVDDAMVEVSCRSVSPGFAEICVIDNGGGVDPDVAEKVFQSFVTTKDAGTGLGLTIVKNIVERHGGDIALRDRQRDGNGAMQGTAGAVASFTLPVA